MFVIIRAYRVKYIVLSMVPLASNTEVIFPRL